MKSIRKQNCILAIVMFALMSILTSFPVQAQTINQKQAKVTVQYASIRGGLTIKEMLWKYQSKTVV